MLEKDRGKILRDKDISLPRIEDFYYNDLLGNNYPKLTKANIFYVEDPPENEDWMGFTEDRALLSVKAKKEAFKISTPYILTNSVTGNNVFLNMGNGNISWPNSSDVTNEIDRLKKRSAFDAYRIKNGGPSDEKEWIKDGAELCLLFFNPPAIPSFTTTVIEYPIGKEEDYIFSKKFSEVKKGSPLFSDTPLEIGGENYIFCKKPYPYRIAVNEETGASAIDTHSPLYKNKEYGYKDDDVLWFTRTAGNTPRQVIKLKKHVGEKTVTQQVLLLNQDNSNPLTVASGYKARDLFVQKIQEAQDIRIVFDVNTMSSQESSVYTQKYPLRYGDDIGPLDQIHNYIKALKNSMFDEQWYATVGYNAYGLDKYKRTHGVVYVKLKNPVNNKAGKQGQEYVWWNLNKYIIYELGRDAESNILSNVNTRYHVDYGPTQLRPYTYDYINHYYVDAFWSEAVEKEKARAEAQKAVFSKNTDLLPNLDGANFEKILYEWTVTLGDVTFFVPPESIRVVSQTATNRIPIMRARGTVAKGTEKSQQFYEISVFFNEERGINGEPFEQATPNYNEKEKTGKKFVYKMNGLRALLAEMKFVPFVPIINKTFNEVFNVYAVCFESLNISTVPGFPKLIKATIELSKFNYQIYMPEVPEEGYMLDDVYYNPFSSCIDYDTLRYYYQRPILLGDLLDMKLRDKDHPISVNSYEFYTKTIFSNRTALLPCHFDDPTIRVYIVNENHLKELDKLKKTLLAKTIDPNNQYSIDDTKQNTNVSDNYKPTTIEQRLIRDASIFMDHSSIAEQYAESVRSIKTLAESLHKPGKYGQFTVLDDGISAEETENGKTKTVKYSCDSQTDTKRFMMKYFYEPLRNKIEDSIKNIRSSQGDLLVKSVNIDDNLCLNIELSTAQYLTSYKDFHDTQQEASVYLAKTNKNTIEPKQIFRDSTIHLQLAKYDGENYLSVRDKGLSNLNTSILSTVIRKYNDSVSDGVINPAIDKNQALAFLNWCRTEALPIADANAHMSELKQSIDLETIHTLKYDLLIGTELASDTTAPGDQNAIVTQFSASVGNTYARTSVSGADGSAPQYMGGQDIHISWTVETMSDEIAGKFKALPELMSYFNRTYRHVLSTYPVKIDSDFTRMIGVTEIMIDNVAVETVPNFPGLYRINVIATSVDRTLRNKEALKALDVKNQKLDISRLLQYRQEIDIKNYKELDKELCKAEIYPDLELPTLNELGQLGYRYVRYKEKERCGNDFYVDPDFYFVYPTILYSKALLESLQYAFTVTTPSYDISQFLVDTSGCVQEVDGKTGGLKSGTENERLKKQIKDLSIMKTKNAEDDKIFHLGGDKSMIFKIPFGSWNLGNKVRCSFTEPYYIQEVANAKHPNTNNRFRINCDGKSDEEIREACKKVNPGYALIELYSEKDKKVISTERNSNYTLDTEKLISRFDELEKTAKEIKDWLKKTKISPILTSRSYSLESEETPLDAGNDEMQRSIRDFLFTDELRNLLKKAHLIGDNATYEFFTNIAKVIAAAADAKSSKVEYNKTSESSNEWRARIADTTKQFTAAEEVNFSLLESFGVFGIRRYTEAGMLSILPSTETEDFKKEIENLSSDERELYEAYYVLDPYYRFKDIKTKQEYLGYCISNPNFAGVAFARIVIWYLAVLVELHILPSIEYDVKRKECLAMTEADLLARQSINKAVNQDKQAEKDKKEEKQGRAGTVAAAKQQIKIELEDLSTTSKKIDAALGKNKTPEEVGVSVLMEGMKNFVKNNGEPLDTGKFLAASVLAMLGEPFRQGTVFAMMKNRQYDDLNNLVGSLVSSKYIKRNEANPTYLDRAPLMRKYLLALYGYGVIDSIDNLGEAKDVSPSNQYLTDYNTKMALLAASNPARYMRDSFYDMVRTDYRGRMLRAFPTFYMIFIDEGREIGLFKLHDNFYNINAITEIQVVKSREIAADTCVITLSNMFQTFTTNDEDCTVNYKGGLGDLWESFWNPRSSAERGELLRLAADKINRAKLQPGIRIHVRMGYGANARDLPVVFNGTIAEIQGNELVKVVAQGDGVELCNPLYEQEDADVVKNNDIRFTADACVCGAPPKDILQSFLTAKGGCIAASLRGRYRGKKANSYTIESAIALRKENADAAKKYSTSGLFSDDEIGTLIDRNLIVTETGDNFYGAINRVLLKYFSDNPYGIFHFGSPDDTAIFSQGEPAQNLYEITTNKEPISNKEIEHVVKMEPYYTNANTLDQSAKETELTQDDFAYFGDAALDLNTEIDTSYSYWNQKDNLPYISFKPFGKTIWDIMHICQSIAPDWMVGIRDFGFRSTIFLGKPHYYYAYKYKLSETGAWIEQRKPYQQWHVYNSSYDIIKNDIRASSEIIKTNAVGLYEVEGSASVQKTDPVWVDQDIYPEYQKSSVVDTNYFGKSYWTHGPFGRIVAGLGILAGIKLVGLGAAALGIATGGIGLVPLAVLGAGIFAGKGLGSLVNDCVSYFSNVLMDKHAETQIDETGPVHSHEKAATKMTINALKNSMRQMYQGYMIIIGDPSVKPQDRMLIEDSYEDLEGMCEIREVVHQLGPNTGFTTTVTPDLICAYDPRTELIKYNMFVHWFSFFTTGLAIAGLNLRFLMKMDEIGMNHLRTLKKAWQLAKEEVKGKETISNVLREAKELLDKATQAKNGAEKSKLCASAGEVLQKIPHLPYQYKKMLARISMKHPLTAGKAIRFFGGKALMIAELALTGINSFVYRQIRNSQVLTLFPLKKFGKVFAAGVDGSQGLLYGAASYEHPGALEQFYARFFSGEAAKDASSLEKAISNINSILFDKDIMEEAHKYQRNVEFVQTAIYDPSNLKEIQLQSLARAQMDKSLYQPKTAYAMSLMPRCVYTKTKESRKIIRNAVKNQTYIENVQDWITDANLNNQCYLPVNKDLERAFNTQYLQLIQDNIIKESKYGIDDPRLQNYHFIDKQGNAISVNALKRDETLEDGKTKVETLDIPYLSEDAKIVLREICEFTLNSLINEPDDNNIRQMTKDTFLILASALQIGSGNPLYRSGYHFILKGTGKLSSGSTSLRNLILKYYQEEEKKLKDAETTFQVCFQVDDTPMADDEVSITVFPQTPYGDSIKQKNPYQVESAANYDGKNDTVKNQGVIFSNDEMAKAESALKQPETARKTYELYQRRDGLQRAVSGTALLDWNSVKENAKNPQKEINARPTGYEGQASFSNIVREDGSGSMLYDKCNLISGHLTNQSDAAENLITGTYQFHKKKESYEKRILSLLDTPEQKYHGLVLYKVTPIYDEQSLVAKAVKMQAVAYPSQDNKYKAADEQLSKAAGLPFNVIVYNVQDGIDIDYSSGKATKKK